MDENKLKTFRFYRVTSLYLVIGSIFFAIPVWVWLIAPALTALPENFSYRADIISIDNFYDAESSGYVGEQRSVTTFGYDSTESTAEGIVVKNVFDVRTVFGEDIFAVERVYGVDPESRKHVNGLGDKEREGYLFAPRNIKKGKSFTYWHINYDGPAHMVFVGEENLFGLKVYRYETRYDGVTIDQTADLGYLPEVGVTRGVILEPYLQIWIEPVTGRLVKYRDNTTAYYYSLETGELLHPWNSFSNTYTRNSVLKQVKRAKTEKFNYFFIESFIPIVFVLFALSTLIFMFRRRVAVVFLILSLISLAVYSFVIFSPKEADIVKIGIARFVESPLQERSIQGFKDSLADFGFVDGNNVVYITPPSSQADKVRHEQLIQSLIDQKIDLIFSLTTPGTLIAKNMTRDIPIVFSVVTYPVESGVIESLKNSNNNLVGTRNWIPVEEQLVNFLELAPDIASIGFVHRKDEPNSTIQFAKLQAVATPRGIDVVAISATNRAELTLLMEEARDHIDSIYSACDTLVVGEEGEDDVIAFAKKHSIPDFACVESGVQKGSLIGTIADYYDAGKLAGEKAGLIIEGAPPQSLSTNTVTRPFIYINKKTADLLGIVVPQELLIKTKVFITQ